MSRQRGTPPRLVIGILTYNGLHHTQRCLESLRAHTRTPFAVVILDNASTDQTPAYLRALNDDRFTVHCGEENLGVGGGRNWLLDHLVPSLHDDDLIVLLDNDIEVAEGWEQPFVEAFVSRPTLGVAGRWGFSMLVHDTWRDILPEDSADSGPVDTVQGCCFWIRAAAARAVGAFDMQLGRFWHEDDDYCIRALHASWDVRRVWTDKITHHEHGSGVALNPDKVAGSLQNQAYLAKKWRALGAIDDAGVPHRPCSESERAPRAELSRRLGRPLLRTEMNSVTMHLTRMLHADVCDAELGALTSPLVRILLQEMTTLGGETALRAKGVDARLQALLQCRRATAPAGRSVPRAFSGICNPDAWDDPRWASVYERAFRDGSGRDSTSRTATAWRNGQLYNALRTLGTLRRDASVLLIGDAHDPLAAAITPMVSALRVADATSLSTMTEPAFDVVLCADVRRHADAAGVPTLLAALAGRVRSGGLVAVAAPVRISGPSNDRVLEASVFSESETLETLRLTRVGSFDGYVHDELLLRATPVQTSLTLRPGLSQCVSEQVITLATLVARVM